MTIAPSEIYRCIADVIDLTDGIRKDLGSIKFPLDTIEPSLIKVDKLFTSMDFSSSWSIFNQGISEDIFRALEQASWIIDNPNFSQFSRDEIKTLSGLCDELKSLFEQLSQVDGISGELKEFLDIYIAQLISGIEKYLRTNDIQSLKQAATSAYSVLGLEKELLKASQSSKEGTEFRSILLKVMQFIGYGNDVKQIADNLMLLASSVAESSNEVVSSVV